MAERVEFNPDAWYLNLVDISSKPSAERYHGLYNLHTTTLSEYVDALQRMSASQVSETSSDGRTRALVVGHILGWEEWQVQVFRERNKMESLQKQMQLKNYVDPVTSVSHDFKSVDDFNEYQARKYSSWNWEDIQGRAITCAQDLGSFFPSQPVPSWIEFLDSTPLYTWKVTKNSTIVIPWGWYLWMVSLEHEAVEHRKDLLVV